MLVQPYLFFEGRGDEAIEFYQSALGAEVKMLMRFKDGPDGGKNPMVPPGSENKIMHAEIRVGDSTILISDGGCSGAAAFASFSLSITVKEDAEADRVFAALSEGGQVRMPLSATFFSSRFGMLADKFGVAWMVYVSK